MKALGRYTNHIYEGDELKTVDECTIFLSGKESAGMLHAIRERMKYDCLLCTNKCPAAIRNEG